MPDQKHTFQGEIVLFDDASSIFSYEEKDSKSFLNIEKHRLEDEFGKISVSGCLPDVVFDISGNRLKVKVTSSAELSYRDIVGHISLLTSSLLKMWEWVLTKYEAPDSATLMQIKNISYVEA